MVRRKACGCECARVLRKGVSTQIVERRTVAARPAQIVVVEGIFFRLLRVSVQHPARIERPCYLVELEGSVWHPAPMPLANRARARCQTSDFQLQPVTAPLIVSLKPLYRAMEIVDVP